MRRGRGSGAGAGESVNESIAQMHIVRCGEPFTADQLACVIGVTRGRATSICREMVDAEVLVRMDGGLFRRRSSASDWLRRAWR